MDDRERAREIAEAARLLFVWLKEPKNTLPGFEYFRDVHTHDMYAGVYVAYPQNPSGFYPEFAGATDDDTIAMRGLGALEHRLLHTNRYDLPRNPPQTMNMLGPKRRDSDIEVEDTLEVLSPKLESLPAEAASNLVHEGVHLWTLRDRVDMVWDSKAEAQQRSFPFAEMLDYKAPRDFYNRDLLDIPPPAGLLGTGTNAHPVWIRKQQDKFYDQLYWNATYTERRRPQDTSTYYTKWKNDHPSEPKYRQPRPSLMHKDYLERNYEEIKLKKDEYYLYIEDDYSVGVVWIEIPWRPGKPPVAQPHLLWVSRKKLGEKKDPGIVKVVFFYSRDGAGKQFQMRQGNRNTLTSSSLRYVVDYKAVVRNFYGGKDPPDLRKDEQWLARYASIMFPDAAVTLPILAQYPNAPLDREQLFLRDLRTARDATPEPLKSVIDSTVKHLEANKELVLLTQGMSLPHEKTFMGIDRAYNLYEWDAKAGVVTRIAWDDFTAQLGIGQLAFTVFENTRGMIPVIKVIVWAGVAVMGGGIVGGGGSAARIMATEWVTSKVSTAAAKKALDKIKPQMLALLVSGILKLMPPGGGLVRFFLHGFLQGLGAGSIEAYVLETDERLERSVNRVIDRATKNAYKVYRWTHRLVNAVHKIAKLTEAIYKVWSDELAQALAAVMRQFSERLATGFLVLLLLILYLDYAYVRGAIPGVISEREWKRMRKKFVGSMFREMREFLHIDALKLRTPPALVDGMLPHDPTAIPRLVKLGREEGKGAAFESLLAEILGDLGIPTWQQIKAMDPWELLEKGLDDYLKHHPKLVEEEVYKLGEVCGSIAGLLMLERSLLKSDKTKKWSEKLPQDAKAIESAVAEGTPRALLRLLKHPLERISERIKQLGTGQAAQQASGQFKKISGHRKLGLAAVRAAVREELRELSELLIGLAADPTLEVELAAIAAGGDDQEFPSLEELASSSEFSGRKAILFALAHCLRIALSEIDQAFEMLEDGKPLKGNLTLGKLLDLFRFDEDSIENIKTFT